MVINLFISLSHVFFILYILSSKWLGAHTRSPIGQCSEQKHDDAVEQFIYLQEAIPCGPVHMEESLLMLLFEKKKFEKKEIVKKVKKL